MCQVYSGSINVILHGPVHKNINRKDNPFTDRHQSLNVTVESCHKQLENIAVVSIILAQESVPVTCAKIAFSPEDDLSSIGIY